MKSFKDFLNENLNESKNDIIIKGLTEAFSKFGLKNADIGYTKDSISKLSKLDKQDEAYFKGYISLGVNDKSVPIMTQYFNIDAYKVGDEGYNLEILMLKGIDISESKQCNADKIIEMIKKINNINVKFNVELYLNNGNYDHIKIF